jgi:hypothetical protein
MMSKLSAPLLLFVLLHPACSHGPLDVAAADSRLQAPDVVASRDSAAAFQTDSLKYSLVSSEYGLQGKIAFEFTNPTSAPVYIVNCQGNTSLRLEKQVGGAWVPAWSPVIRECLSPPIVVHPGQRYSGVVHVFSGHPNSNLYPQFVVDPVPGVFRVVWDDVLINYDDREYPFGDPLPLEHRVSNRFELRVTSP